MKAWQIQQGDVLQVDVLGCLVFAQNHVGVFPRHNDVLEGGTLVTVVGLGCTFDKRSYVECIWAGGKGLLVTFQLEPF